MAMYRGAGGNRCLGEAARVAQRLNVAPAAVYPATMIDGAARQFRHEVAVDHRDRCTTC